MTRVYANRYKCQQLYRRLLSIFLLSILHLIVFNHFVNAQTNLEKRTKLCGDPKCSVDLFSSKSIREYMAQDSSFHQLKEGTDMKIYTFKFSNRPEFMEAEIDGRRGLIYNNHIDLIPYVFFLENALKTNQKLYMVEQETGKFIREISAIPELMRDYTAYAAKTEGFQLDKELVAKLMVLEQQQQGTKGHGHGHSHEHGGSHGHGHGHSHEHEEVKGDDGKKMEQMKVKKDITGGEPKVEEKLNQEPPKTGQKPPSVEVETKAQKITPEEEKIVEIKMTAEKPEEKKAKPEEETNGTGGDQTSASMNDSSQSKEETKIPVIKIEEEKPASDLKKMGEETGKEGEMEMPIKKLDEREEQKQQGIIHEVDKAEERTPKTADQSGEDVKNQTEEAEMSNTTTDAVHGQTQQAVPPAVNEQQPASIVQPLQAEGESQQQQKDAPGQTATHRQQQPNPVMENDVPASVTPSSPAPQHADIESMANQQPEQKPLVTPMMMRDGDDPILKNMVVQQFGANSNIPPAPSVVPAERVVEKVQQSEMNSAAENVPKVIPPPAAENVTPSPASLVQQQSTPPSVENPISLESIQQQPPLEKSKESTGAWNSINIVPPSPPQMPEPLIAAAEPIPVEPKLPEMLPLKSQEEAEKVDEFCFKDDCHKLDDIPSDTNQPPTDSAVRRMFRETMASVRAMLPEPLCHFEDTGLIVLLFVIIATLIHLTNMLLSKSPGPEPFDHRLLHDCITRLKEQELIIEQMKAKAADNQRLAEVAKAAEQLQKENKVMAHRLQMAAEIEADNGKLKNALKNIHHELEQHKTMVDELKQSVEMKDAEIKQLDSEVQRLETDLDSTTAQLAQAQNREKHMETDLKEAREKITELKRQLNAAQKEAEEERTKSAEKQVEADALLAVIAELQMAAATENVSQRRGNKRGSSASIDESKEREMTPEEKKTKKTATTPIGTAAGKPKAKKNGDDDNGSSSPDSSPGQLVDAAELDPDNNGVGSGGSAGWSDLGDGIEAPEAEVEAAISEMGSPSKSKDGKSQHQQKPKKKITPKQMEKQIVEEEEGQEAEDKDKSTKMLDILEMAKLKSRLRSLETEKEQLKFSLKVEREEKESAQKELERLRRELVERERDSEQRELDRHGLTQQCTKLLQMIEEKERKVELSEQERERLRTRLSDVELELRRVEDDKREVQHRLKELEQSLKRSEELNGRLENKLYHEERRFNSKIRQLEEQLTLAKSSLSPMPMNMSGGGMSSDLNMSGNSSDREFIPISGPEGAAGGGVERRSAVPSLWSEIDANEQVEELVSLERQAGNTRRRRSIRTGGAESHRESPYLADLVHVSASGREERLQQIMNNSRYSAVSGSASNAAARQRVRSRSAGRQSARLTGVSAANPLYGTIGPSASLYASAYQHQQHRSSVVPQSGKNSPYRQLPDRPHSAARLRNMNIGQYGQSSSSAVAAAASGAYSSDSNGASSPPPEMPLLSGVPPPGLNKRPAVLPVAPRPTVQLHKPAAPLPK